MEFLNMSELKWLLDERFIDHNDDSLILETMRKLNYDYEVKNYQYNNRSKNKNYTLGDIGNKFKPDDSLMMLGTIKFVSDHLKLPNPFGSLFQHKNVNVIDVLSNFKKYEIDNLFLNSDIHFNYFNSIVDNIDEYLESYGEFFIRPNGSLKSFTGFLLNKDNYKTEIKRLVENNRVDGVAICAISPAKSIINETRFIIVGDEVVSSSKYIVNGDVKSERGCSVDSYNVANSIAKHKWNNVPDIAYVVDVAETKFEAKVIELNCYSTSGFYKCDPVHIELVNNSVLSEINSDY